MSDSTVFLILTGLVLVGVGVGVAQWRKIHSGRARGASAPHTGPFMDGTNHSSSGDSGSSGDGGGGGGGTGN